MESFTIFTSSATVDPIISNNKEIDQYFSRSLTEFKDFSRRLLKFKTFSKLYEPSSQMANFHAQNQAEQQFITTIHRTAVREMFLHQELVIIICQGVLFNFNSFSGTYKHSVYLSANLISYHAVKVFMRSLVVDLFRRGSLFLCGCWEPDLMINREPVKF